MKFKLLALSITMLGYVGCATHPMQQQNAALNEKVYRSYEQLVSKQSYAYDGKMTFQVEPTKKTTVVETQQVPEKTRQQKLLDQLLVQQKNINAQQQQWMKDGVNQENSSYSLGRTQKFEQVLQSFLNRYYYSFDGVVDLKNGQISMNPKIGYAAKNAQGWLTVPLALDIKNLKAYADISALSPIVTDPKYDGQYVVFDFQEIAKKEKFNVRPLLEIMREWLLLNSALATEDQYKKLPLTAEDRKLNASERIQYSGEYSELMTQYFLFFYLNEAYFKKIFDNGKLDSALNGLNPMGLALGDTSQLEQLSSSLSSHGADALNSDSEAMYRLFDAIDAVVEDANQDGAETVYAFDEPSPPAVSGVPLSDIHLDDISRLAELEAKYTKGKEACATKSTASEKAACLSTAEATYAADIATAVEHDEDAVEESVVAQDSKFEKFAAYKSEQLINAQKMKQIIAEQPEAYQALVNEFASTFDQLKLFETGYTTDLVLDQKGRLIRAEMDVSINGLKEIGLDKIVTKTEMNIHSYGSAKVDQQQLRNAVSFKEASNENSILNLGKMWDKFLSEEKSAVSPIVDESADWSRTTRYEKLAESLFAQNLSMLDAYAALYRYAYILEGEDTEYEDFDFKQLNDTARWTAIYYADEFDLPLTTKEKAEYENSPDEWYYYDEYIADGVWRAIDAEQKTAALKKSFNQLRKQGKSDAQIFSQLYLDLETKNEQRLTGEKTVKFSPEYLEFVKTLGVIAIEDTKSQKIDIEKLKKFDQQTLDRVNSVTYKQVYKLFIK